MGPGRMHSFSPRNAMNVAHTQWCAREAKHRLHTYNESLFCHLFLIFFFFYLEISDTWGFALEEVGSHVAFILQGAWRPQRPTRSCQLRGAEVGRPSLPLALLSPHNVAHCHSVQVGGIFGDPLSQEQREQYNVSTVSEKWGNLYHLAPNTSWCVCWGGG